MLEAALTFLAKAAGSLVGPAWTFLSARFRRPSIKLVKAPTNLLDHIKLSASPEHVKALLGAPHQLYEWHWAYRFEDLLVQIEFWPNGGAKTIAVGLVGREKRYYYRIPGCSKPLGSMSIADALQEIDSLRYRSSLRHEDVLVAGRIGPPGAWQCWTFGATRAVSSRALHESFFEWDRTNNRLLTAPSMVLVNWVAVSSSDDEVWFDWSTG